MSVRLNPQEIVDELAPAIPAGHRLVLRGLARDAQLKVLLPLLKRELDLEWPALRQILSHPPQPLWALPDITRARKAQTALARLGCVTTLEDVTRFRQVPFVLATATLDVVNQRLRASTAGQFAVAILRADSSALCQALLRLDVAKLLQELGGEGSIDRLDCRHLLIGAPVDPREGAMALRYRLLRELPRRLGSDRDWRLGIALYPVDGADVEVLLTAAIRRAGGEPDANTSERQPSAAPQASADPAQQLLQLARGGLFATLSQLPAADLAATWRALPAEVATDFVARLWWRDESTAELITALPTVSPAPPDRLLEVMPATEFAAGLLQRRTQQNKITALLHHSEQLPALPQLVSQLLQMSVSNTATAENLTDLIQQDPGLTARLLALVNSAFFGFHREITSVKHAVVILGADEIANLATSLASSRLFHIDGRLCGFSATDLWQHANAVAAIARDLAAMETGIAPATAFTAGLLHDIGRSFLLQHGAADYAEICREARERGLPLYSVEEDRLGLDHARIGQILAQHWNLPPALTTAVGCHHAPQTAGDHQALAAVVGLADRLHHQILNAASPDGMLTVGHQRALDQRFGDLLPDSLAMLASEVAGSLERAARLSGRPVETR